MTRQRKITWFVKDNPKQEFIALITAHKYSRVIIAFKALIISEGYTLNQVEIINVASF